MLNIKTIINQSLYNKIKKTMTDEEIKEKYGTIIIKEEVNDDNYYRTTKKDNNFNQKFK